MSFQSLLIDSVTVYTQADDTTDIFGNPTDDFGSGTAYRARVEQVGASEIDNGLRDTRSSLYNVYLEAGAVVGALDEITWGGERHRVRGDPDVVSDGVGSHHIELVMERING